MTHTHQLQRIQMPDNKDVGQFCWLCGDIFHEETGRPLRKNTHAYTNTVGVLELLAAGEASPADFGIPEGINERA